MADPKDLERLLTYEDLTGLDLSGADLREWGFEGAELYDINLRGADLRDADLRDANLTDADLSGANLTDADLSGANLTDADLSGANLERAIAKRVDLRGADLREADLRDANLAYADFLGADFTDSDLTDANLNGAKNIPLTISDKFSHKGETVEEKKRREKEKRLRLKTINNLELRVSKAKTDKELEALAKEVGSLQAQADSYRLNILQADIEEKYSLLGGSLLFLKKLFSRGRRASQIRTASQMLNQLNKEISDLKKELSK
jgi:uncharacterized protein YjbI with pentapeptide repeats